MAVRFSLAPEGEASRLENSQQEISRLEINYQEISRRTEQPEAQEECSRIAGHLMGWDGRQVVLAEQQAVQAALQAVPVKPRMVLREDLRLQKTEQMPEESRQVGTTGAP